MNEFEDIPIAFGREHLPPGETILWQGRPDWRRLALAAFWIQPVALYFTILAAWRIVADLHDGLSRSAALTHAAGLLVPAVGAIAVLTLLAWLAARATNFTLTERRLVMRYGIALPALLNIPLADVDAMRVRKGAGHTGDIAFVLPDRGRLSYHQLWPYARAWRLFPAEPMLRAVPEAETVGALFAEALRKAASPRPGQVIALRRPEPADGAVAAAKAEAA